MWRSLVSGSLFRHERVASPPADPPEQVLLFVEEIRPRLTLISLTPEEYLTSIYKTAERGFTSGAFTTHYCWLVRLNGRPT